MIYAVHAIIQSCINTISTPQTPVDIADVVLYTITSQDIMKMKIFTYSLNLELNITIPKLLTPLQSVTEQTPIAKTTYLIHTKTIHIINAIAIIIHKEAAPYGPLY